MKNISKAYLDSLQPFEHQYINERAAKEDIPSLKLKISAARKMYPDYVKIYGKGFIELPSGETRLWSGEDTRRYDLIEKPTAYARGSLVRRSRFTGYKGMGRIGREATRNLRELNASQENTPVMNLLIGDNFFKKNPSKILGTQITKKGRFGNDMIVVNGNLSNLNSIDAAPVQVADAYPEHSFSPVVEQTIIDKVFEAEEKEITTKSVTRRRQGKSADVPVKQTHAAVGNDTDIYTFEEIDKLYNAGISREEKEAYYITHPELNHKLLFDKYENSIDDLRRKKLICWDVDLNRYDYVYTYQSGNISKKISQLKQKSESFIEKFGEKQFDDQIELLNAVKPKQKGLIGDEKIVILPHSNFAKNIKITELRYGKPELHSEASLFYAFTMWLRYLPADQFNKTTSREIIDYYLQNKNIPVDQKASKEQKAKDEKVAISIRQRTKEEGDQLFSRFLSDELTIEDQQKVQFLWNEKFNSYAEPILTKTPVCFRISRKFKKADLMLNPTQRQAAAFQTEKKSALLAYGVGVGKSLKNDSNVLTPTGYAKMGSLKVGDYVIGKNGKKTKVLGVFPQGERPIYEIIFSDGARVECDEEHLWNVQRIKQKDHKSKNWNTMTTREIIDYGLYNKRGNYMFSIPMVEPIEFTERPLLIDPYVMGCLIGDGCLGNDYIGFSNPESDILDKVRDLIPASTELRHKSNYDWAISRKSAGGANEVLTEIRDLSLDVKGINKFIPEKYLFNSLENRLKLLQGLIDTDGYIKTGKRENKKGCTVLYYTVSIRLAKDIQFLCQTFGGTASIQVKEKPRYMHKGEVKHGHDCYIVSLKLPSEIIPVSSTKQLGKFSPKTKYQPTRFIESINRIDDAECTCIKVDAEDQLFVIDHCVVTHNTLASIVCFSQSYYNGYAKKGVFVVPTNTYDKWLGEIGGYLDNTSGEYMHGALPQFNLVGIYNLNPTLVRETLKDYSKEDEKIFTAIQKAVEFLKSIDKKEITATQRSLASKIHPIPWPGIEAQYEYYLESSKAANKKTFIQYTIDYLKEEFNYNIYALGTMKNFPDGTIFVTTEVGLQRFGVPDSDKEVLGSRLFKILSQGEQSAGEGDKRDIAGLQLKIEQTISSSQKNAKLLVTDFGIDWVCFDEAHYYKKIFTFVKGDIVSEKKDYETGEIKGYKRDKSKYELKSGSYPSSRALSAFVLSHYIQYKSDNRNVIQLTATPFTNSPLEVYSMLSLTNYKALEDIGLAKMVDFFDTFMKINYDIKYTPQKTVVKDVVLTGYNNLPQLRQVIYSLMDKKDEGASLKRPTKHTWPSIEKGIETTLPMTAEQEELMAEVKKYINDSGVGYSEVCGAALSEEMDNQDFDGLSDEDLIAQWELVTLKDYEGERENLNEAKRESLIKQIKTATPSGMEIMEGDMGEEESKGVRILKGLSMMRQITLSPYLYYKACRKAAGEAPVLPDYMDYVSSSPKFKYVMGCIKSAMQWHNDNGTKPGGHVIYMNAGVEYFQLLKQYLVKELKFRESQVGIVSGSMSKSVKENTKQAFLRGDILVLIGSSTISVGVDLQNNATTGYNLYYDWNPTDAAQIEGRIWRQGNRFANVRWVYPQCYNSADPVIFEYLSSKTLRINEIWNRSSEVQELDLRDFNPKELQKKLITDPEEKAEWEVLEEEEKVEGEIIFAENRREMLQEAMYAFREVNKLRPTVKEYLTQISTARLKHTREIAVNNQSEKMQDLMDKFSDDPEKLTKELTNYQKNRYDHKKDPDGKYKAPDYTNADDKTLFNDCKKYNESIDDWSHKDSYLGDLYYNRWDIQKTLKSFRTNYRDQEAANERVLKPMGLSFETAQNPIGEFDSKIDQLRAQKSAIEESMPARVEKYRLEAAANRSQIKSVQDRVSEFAEFNARFLGPQLIINETSSPVIAMPDRKQDPIVAKAEEKLKVLEAAEDKPFITDEAQIRDAVREMAAKSKNAEQFLRTLSVNAGSWNVDPRSGVFMKTFDLVDGDKEGNRKKLISFYKTDGAAEKKDRKQSQKDAIEQTHVDNIERLAIDTNEKMEQQIDAASAPAIAGKDMIQKQIDALALAAKFASQEEKARIEKQMNALATALKFAA